MEPQHGERCTVPPRRECQKPIEGFDVFPLENMWKKLRWHFEHSPTPGSGARSGHRISILSDKNPNEKMKKVMRDMCWQSGPVAVPPLHPLKGFSGRKRQADAHEVTSDVCGRVERCVRGIGRCEVHCENSDKNTLLVKCLLGRRSAWCDLLVRDVAHGSQKKQKIHEHNRYEYTASCFARSVVCVHARQPTTGFGNSRCCR